MSELIIVTGYARSGTSLMCRMLAAAGFEVIQNPRDRLDIDNPHGYLESRRVSQLAKDPAADLEFVQANGGRVLKVLCHMLPKLPRAGRYRTIFMVRPPEEIQISVEKMNARRMKRAVRELPADPNPSIAKSVARGRKWCEEHAAGHLVVSYHELVRRPRSSSRRVARFVGRHGAVSAMADCVEPSLYRNRVVRA